MWWEPSNPNEIKASVWMHPAAVLYLESLLTSEMDVIEHGCGGSTLWFAERVASVRSYDDNAAWVDSVALILPDNADVVQYADVPYISNKADLLLIDGNGKRRPLWILEAQNLVKPGGLVVLDNSNREQYQPATKELLKICHMPTLIDAWTDYGKPVQTAFFRLKGGLSWV